jgi:hypothetical protein
MGANGLGPAQPALAIDSSDGCHQQREDFAKSKDYFTDQIVTGLATGALVGAGVGAVAGLALGVNPLKAAAVGGGLGLAAGGTSAYAKVMAEKHKDNAELAKSVNDDLTKEGQEIDHTTAAFARLRSCRFDQASFIKTQVRQRRVDRASALQQLNVEKGRFAEEIALAKQYDISMDKRGAEYKEAADTIRQQELADQQREKAALSQAEAVRMAAAVSIPNKRESFKKSIMTAETNSDIAFNLDSNKRVSSLTVSSHA